MKLKLFPGACLQTACFLNLKKIYFPFFMHNLPYSLFAISHKEIKQELKSGSIISIIVIQTYAKFQKSFSLLCKGSGCFHFVSQRIKKTQYPRRLSDVFFPLQRKGWMTKLHTPFNLPLRLFTHIFLGKNPRVFSFPSPSLTPFPAISLAITQLTQQNQSVLNFSWDPGDLLMNLQRGEKLTVLSYAWCCQLTWSQKCLKR